MSLLWNLFEGLSMTETEKRKSLANFSKFTGIVELSIKQKVLTQQGFSEVH